MAGEILTALALIANPMQAQEAPLPDTITTYYELVGETNSGFEYPEDEMDWVKDEENGGVHGFVKLHGNTDPSPPKGEYVAVLSANGDDLDSASVNIYLDLSDKDNILKELDSLILFAKRWQQYDEPDNWNFHIDLIGKKNSIEDTISFLWGDTNYIIEGEHRFVYLCESSPIESWVKQGFSEELKTIINENGLVDHEIEGIRLRMVCPIGLLYNTIKLDEVYLWAHRDSVTAVSEQPIAISPLELQALAGNRVMLSGANGQHVDFTRYNAAGQVVDGMDYADGVYNGDAEIEVQSDGVSGVYFVRARTAESSATAKIVSLQTP